jgi:hydrogenase expression/formation protein HypC
MCLAVPARVESISGEGVERRAIVLFGDIAKEVSLALTPEADLGDYVLVHAGFAIGVIDEEEAQRTLAMLAELGEEE